MGTDLCESHILPDFLYEVIYDEQHRFLHLSTDPGLRVVSRPTGLYERLLCKKCEARMSRWEGYARGLFHGGPSVTLRKEPWGFTAVNVQYGMLKLFGMSLLWRAGISRRPEFGEVVLGRHEERLRQMLDAEEPGRPHEYGWALLFPPDGPMKELFSHIISPPHLVRHGGHHAYRFVLGVMHWIFVVSNHMDQMDPRFFSLSEEGTLRVVCGGPPMVRFLEEFAADIAGASRARRGS